MKTYLIATIMFFVIDMLWLGIIARDIYNKQIGFLLKTEVNWIAAIIFYLLFIAGLTFFVINPALKQEKTLISTAIMGGFFGLVTYATYDLTNLATLKNWPLSITIIDLIWGTTIGSLVSSITAIVVGKLKS
ncbi:DUF2177 family protein [Patescibacteria group bacterium]|nr:DUF2177 family protein [Patescibacteria group bacterium]